MATIQELKSAGQGEALRFFDSLSEAEKASFMAQLDTIDVTSIVRMQKMLLEGDSAVKKSEPKPPFVFECAGDLAKEAVKAGEAELRRGAVAALLVAGGQGSRLGFDGPKGAYKIGPISDEPLFYFHARKLLALERAYGKVVPFYIMTSETNDAATRKVFAENNYFGLKEENVVFFTQGMWPALDNDGKIILDRKDHIFMSPDGHGGTLWAMKARGVIADMERRGISTVFYFQVDNPMVAICDPEFIGLHLLKKADLSIKVCAKRDPQEGLGVVVERDGKFEMVEYTELTDEEKNRRRDDGELYFKYGSVAIHVFSFDFMKREADVAMPLHIAHKKIAYVDANGDVVKPEKPNGNKFEKFIFDVIPDAKNLINVAFLREDEFSPVKNAEGNDSPASCRRDLIAKWARWLKACGVLVPENAVIEIDPAFANSAAELKARIDAGATVLFDANGSLHLVG